jgi:exportin-1
VIQYCFQYVTSLTELPLDTNYKVCAEFWHEFTSRLLDAGNSNSEVGGGPLLLNLYGAPQQMTLKSSVYPKLLMDIRKIIVSHMSKPQEVLITVDESGMPCREEMTNTENNAMYELLRELMINLAKLNWNSTKDIIIQKLDK